MSKNVVLSVDELFPYIREILNQCIEKEYKLPSSLYHHNTTYQQAPSIIEYGILSAKDRELKGISQYNSKERQLISDTNSHINGYDGISLSKVGLTDLYRNEFEYDSLDEQSVDFIISNDIETKRNTINYGNEFVTYQSINQDKIKAIDIRLLKLIDFIERRNENKDIIIKNLTFLKEIILSLKKMNLNIPVREMSKENNLLLDIKKIEDIPKILLK